jgi:hypothetical protein
MPRPVEKIVQIKKSNKKDKKYMAFIKGASQRNRVIHFGARDYEQYRDSTKLGLYRSKNHGDKKRRSNYFKRHSGTSKKSEAIHKEFRKSHGKYNAKILSHKYLW